MPERLQLRSTKGWRKPEGAVIVTRPGIFGNPWIVGDYAPASSSLDAPRLTGARVELIFAEEGLGRCICEAVLPRTVNQTMAVLFFRWWIEGAEPEVPIETLTDLGRRKVAADFARRRAAILARLPELRGKDLCCWCPPGSPCHADVLLEIANG